MAQIKILDQNILQYKCFVGKGNNSQLIRQLFRNRFWWSVQEKQKLEKVHFIWTQLRYKNILNGLMPKLTCPAMNTPEKNQLFDISVKLNGKPHEEDALNKSSTIASS